LQVKLRSPNRRRFPEIYTKSAAWAGYEKD
jgi:hypothetical protein